MYAIRALYDYLTRGLDVPVNPARQVTPPAQPKTKTTDYSNAQLDRLLTAALDAAADAQARGLHRAWVRARFDHAVLATFRYTGVRLTELCDLTLANLHLDRRVLEVNGKGSRQRYIPLPAELVAILRNYLREVRHHCPPSTRLFANPSGYAGTAMYGQLAQRAAFDIVVKYAEAAGLTGAHHPHRLRHSYATDLLRRGASLEAIRRLLGHSSVQTTIRYLHLDGADLEQVIDRAFTHSAIPDHDRDDGEAEAA